MSKYLWIPFAYLMYSASLGRENAHFWSSYCSSMPSIANRVGLSEADKQM